MAGGWRDPGQCEKDPDIGNPAYLAAPRYSPSTFMPLLSLNPKIYLTNLHLMCINTHMDSRKIIRMLKKNGWYKANQSGSHIQFRHPTKNGRVTVPHPEKDIPIGTLRSIERESGIKFK